MSEVILSVENLSKKFKAVTAIEGITFDVNQGEVFGIIGPNGSGKTTTLSIILSLIKSDTGKVIFKNNLTKKSIGAYLDSAGFNPQLSIINNLRLSAIIKGVDDRQIVNDALKKVGLEERENEIYKNLSLGMKQRLAIATTFLGNPQLIILDEPTNGLDPYGIVEVRDLIAQLNQQGITIIIASHILTEMEKICSRVAIYSKSKLVTVDETTNLISKYGSLENAFLKSSEKI